MQNQHPIEPGPECDPRGRGWCEMLLPARLLCSTEPSSMSSSFGQSLTDSCAFLFSSRVVLAFDECVGAHVGGCSLFLETNLPRSNSISTVSNGEIIAR